MAAFISSIETGFLRFPCNSPFSSLIERLAGTIANWPLACSTNSRRSPASKPRARRTREGMVIWPFEVRVATAMGFPRICPYTIVKNIRYVKDSSQRTAVMTLGGHISWLPKESVSHWRRVRCPYNEGDLQAWGCLSLGAYTKDAFDVEPTYLPY